MGNDPAPLGLTRCQRAAIVLIGVILGGIAVLGFGAILEMMR